MRSKKQELTQGGHEEAEVGISRLNSTQRSRALCCLAPKQREFNAKQSSATQQNITRTTKITNVDGFTQVCLLTDLLILEI